MQKKTFKQMNCNFYNFILRISLLLVILFPNATFATEEDYEPDLVPPSPSVSLFQDFTESNVSHYNGRFPFSIPFYEVSNDFFNLPISLTYQTNGVKVNDISGPEGMGWNITTGGIISRIVKGKPDELKDWGAWDNLPALTKAFNSFPDFENDLNSFTYQDHTCGIDAFYHLLIDNSNQNPDWELDIYTYAFGRYNGKFVITRDSGEYSAYLLNNQGIDIEVVVETIDNQAEIKGFIIRADDGSIYYFGDTAYNHASTPPVEKTESFSYSTNSAGSIDINNRPLNYTNAWHLQRVSHIDFSKNVDFEYMEINEIDVSIAQSREGFEGSQADPIVESETTLKYVTHKLKRIKWNGNLIEYHYNINNRHDLLESKGAKLDSVQLIYNENAVIKTMVLNNSFVPTNNSRGALKTDEYLKKRLFLNSVKIIGSERIDTLQYSFTYNNPTALPFRLAASADRWGYYNGKDNPNLIEHGYNIIRTGWADRSVGQLSHCSAGSLKNITTPGGGAIHITYGSNFVGTDILYGGIRVDQIDYYGDGCDPSQIITMDYRNSGTKPNNFIPLNISKTYVQNGTTDLNGCQLIEKNIYSSTAHNLSFTKGNSVGYTKVRKKVFNYTNQSSLVEEYEFYGPWHLASNLYEFDESCATDYDNYSTDINWMLELDFIGGTNKSVRSYKEVDGDSLVLINEKLFEYSSIESNTFVPLISASLLWKWNNYLCDNPLPADLYKNSAASIQWMKFPVNFIFRLRSETHYEFFDEDTLNEEKNYVYNDSIVLNPSEILIGRSGMDSTKIELSYLPEYDANHPLTLRPTVITERRKYEKRMDDWMASEGTKFVRTNTRIDSILYAEVVNGNPYQLVYPNDNRRKFVAFEYDSDNKPIQRHSWDQPSMFYHWNFNINPNQPSASYSFVDGTNNSGFGTHALIQSINDQGFYISSLQDLENVLRNGSSETVRKIRDGYVQLYEQYPNLRSMNIYNFKPMVGVSSSIDQLSNALLYDYDGLGRLVKIMDQDKKVIKQHEYNLTATAECLPDNSFNILHNAIKLKVVDNNGDPIVGHTLAVYGSTYCISCLDKTDSCYISLNKLVDSLETDNNGFIEISLGGENSDFVTSSQCPSFKIVDSNGNTNKNHYIMLDENNYGYLEIVYNPYEGQEIGTTTFDIGFSCSGSALIPNGSQANSVLIRIRVGDSGSFIPDLNGAHPINNTSFVISDGVVQGDNLLKVQIKEPDSSIWHACHPDENISIDLGSSNVTENNSQYYFNRSNIYEDETINLVLIYDSICEIDDSIN